MLVTFCWECLKMWFGVSRPIRGTNTARTSHTGALFDRGTDTTLFENVKTRFYKFTDGPKFNYSRRDLPLFNVLTCQLTPDQPFWRLSPSPSPKKKYDLLINNRFGTVWVDWGGIILLSDVFIFGDGAVLVVASSSCFSDMGWVIVCKKRQLDDRINWSVRGTTTVIKFWIKIFLFLFGVECIMKH